MGVKSLEVPPGLADAQPPGGAKLTKAQSPGLKRQANAPQLPRGGGGGFAHLELTDALYMTIPKNFEKCGSKEVGL